MFYSVMADRIIVSLGVDDDEMALPEGVLEGVLAEGEVPGVVLELAAELTFPWVADVGGDNIS